MQNVFSFSTKVMSLIYKRLLFLFFSFDAGIRSRKEKEKTSENSLLYVCGKGRNGSVTIISTTNKRLDGGTRVEYHGVCFFVFFPAE